jgi:large subunit ribosomal protein L24
MNKLKKGDNVVVLVGRDKGKKGKILTVFPKTQEVEVEKINIVKRHVKPTKEDKGGIVEMVKPVSWSKVRLICPHSEKPTGVSYIEHKGKKKRKSKKSGELIG